MAAERAKRRGRPRKIHRNNRPKLRVSDPAYDAYAIQSAVTGVPIVTLMRRVVEVHAPVIFRGPDMSKG